jgi:hypothetical protein
MEVKKSKANQDTTEIAEDAKDDEDKSAEKSTEAPMPKK